MSARRTDMHRIQELVRLHRLGQGQRSIAKQLRMGRETIRTYQGKLREAGLLEGCPGDLPDSAVLKEVVGEGDGPGEQIAQTPSSVKQWKPKISQLYEKGCGPTAIHDHLRLCEPDYSGSLCCNQAHVSSPEGRGRSEGGGRGDSRRDSAG